MKQDNFKGLKLGLLLALACAFGSSRAQQRPNIIFVLADDLGYGDLGCYGQKLIKTPYIDRLASEGMRFTQFYAGSSVCAPSRAALMTGQHTGHTAIRGNQEIEPEGQFPLPDSVFTIAEMLKKAGYATGVFGKWGMGYPGSSGDPLNQGFDRFFGYNCQRQSHNFFPDHLWSDSTRVECMNTATDQRQYAPDLIQEEALKFMSANKDRPFFMFLTYTLPHAALQLPKDDQYFKAYKRQFRETAVAVPAVWDGKGYQPQAYPLATYAAMVSRLDWYVGEVIGRLKSLGLDENTLIVFTSDNGPHREGGNRPEYFNSSGGLRGIKRDLYEGGIRVPLIVRWPGLVKEKAQTDLPAAAWDMLPTFAGLTGQGAPRNTDGVSLLPTWTGSGMQTADRSLYWEFHEDGFRQAVRLGKWKGVRVNIRRNRDAAVQLFDLKLDPFERNDVSAANPQIVTQIKAIMEKEHVEDDNFPMFSSIKIKEFK